MVGKSNNVLVEYDYQNIILIDPNKLISDDGKAEERLVDHEDMVMYANLTCKLIPRTKLAIGADIDNSIREITLAEINFLSQQTLDGRNALNNIYTDEITGKDTLKSQGINQPKNISAEVQTKDGKTQSIITQETVNKGKTGSFNTGLLGITSISIKNSGSFIPTVTIEFEDVRGRALFERGDQSPYAAFFHLPYPIFYLTIKGFYGKAVKYPLHLYTFNSRFNTMTGNYQVTCVFYSYKYGVLADLSMGCLYSLPLMYQSEYDITTNTKSLQTDPNIGVNDSNTQTKTLTTSKGTQKLIEVYSDYKSKGIIPKSFPEINIQQLKHKLETLESKIKEELGNQDMGSLTDADTYSEDLKKYILDVYSVGNDSWFDKYIDKENYVFDKNKIKIFFYKPEIATNPEKQSKAKQDLISLVDKYNGKIGRNKTFGVNGKFNNESFSIPNQINFDSFIYGTINMEDGIDYEYTYLMRNGSKPDQAQLKKFKEEIKKLLLNGQPLSEIITLSEKEGFFFDGQINNQTTPIRKGFLNLITDMLGKDGLQKRKEVIENKLSQIIANILESNTSGLGFRPTIKNISAVFFASAEAFLRLMDDTHTSAWNVRNDNDRKNAILNNPGATSVEKKDFVNSLTGTTDYPVYPWPQLFSEKKDDKGNTRYEITYPADENVINFTRAYDYTKWPEVEFEEEFIKSMINRNKLPLDYVDNNTESYNKLSLNSVEFPIVDKPFSIRQVTKFIYEMWERFILSSSYDGIYDKNLVDVFSEIEVKNIENSQLENDPYLLNVLKNYNINSFNIERVLENISNSGVGESYLLYSRGLFTTQYIKSSLENSFVILGKEYYDQKKTNPGISLSDTSLNKISNFITGSTINNPNEPKFMELYPYSFTDWATNNLSKNVSNDIFDTNKVLVYNNEKKLIANFTGSSQSPLLRRPYTNESMYSKYSGVLPDLYNNIPSNFYQERYKNITSNGNVALKQSTQLITEGRINYSNYTNQISNNQTTSIINTPIFINAIEKGVDNYLVSNSASNPPYIEAGYLFINSLPLSTLKEKYINIDGNGIITDLNYLLPTFKKYGALHKLPYAWVLKYGSIWHRYKKWVETGKDFLDDVWKDFDYKNSWDPENSGVTSWDIGTSTVTLSNEVNKNINIGLGFYPKTINYLNIFYQSENIFTEYTQDEVKKGFTSKKIIPITGSPTADKFFPTGHNLSNTALTLNVKTYTFLTDTIIPKKGKYILPSFGSNVNQIYDECFSGKTMVTPISGNTTMYNGSVRMFYGVSNYGFFDVSKVEKPLPNQYMKIINTNEFRQSAFSLGGRNSYSYIDEIFSVFEKESLDQFEIQFLNWCKAESDVNGKLPITNDQFEGATEVDSINKQNYNNFQKFFKQLMFIDDSDLTNVDFNNSTDSIKKLQNIQYNNFQNQIASFLEYDVVIKYGNPTFFNRRTFYSVANISGNTFGNVIEDPIDFGFYGDNNSGIVPDSNTGSIPLSTFKNGNKNAWKALETYVGFSNIEGIRYSNTGSTITDFFPDLNVSFNAENIKVLSPIIKIYATKKKKNSSYDAKLFFSDINEYLNYLKDFRNSSFDVFMKSIQNKLSNITPIRKINSQKANLQGDQTRVELWEMFKALNDKWIAGNNYTNRTLFEDVLFLDRGSRDIGDKVFIDIYKLKSQMTDINMDGRIMGFMMDFIMSNNFVVMSVPAYVNFYNAQDSNPDLKPKSEGSAEFANTMFGTHLTVDIRNSSPKLVCFYVDKVSEHPEIENSEYRWGTDSFDLRRFSDNPLIENQIGKNDWSRSNKVVGFNVDVGIRNQNMFSNVILAQDPGKATSEALRILDLMANSASGKQTATQNVSLFNLYKTRSYTCTVESMGNAMIQPTMYFNLRHVPMFNGPYMILSVEHSIQPGSFRTTFSGVRQSKYSLPLIEDFIQNIFKLYLSKFIEDVRREIEKDEVKSRTIISLNVDSIVSGEEKEKIKQDCRPENQDNAIKFVLTNDTKYTTNKEYPENDIRRFLSKITDVRTRLLVFSAIYNSSYKNGSYSAYADNLIGYDLDNQIKGDLSKYLIKQHICVDAGGKKKPLAIFINAENMINFANAWFGSRSKNLKGKIDALAPQTLSIYLGCWPTTKDQADVDKIMKNNQTFNEIFERANQAYLRLFPEDKDKTF